MYQFAETYAGDIGQAASLPLPVWFGMVGSIPYRSDDELFPQDPDKIVEVVARPAYLLDGAMFPKLDCKKKSILIGAWAAMNGVPFAFLAVSQVPSKMVHHVFPMVKWRGIWTVADATLPEYRLGEDHEITYAEELQR